MDLPFYVTTFVWVINKDKYASMSDNQKKANLTQQESARGAP